MIRKIAFFSILIVAFASCNTETVFKEVKVNNRYSISIPDYLQPCVDLHKDASFQYQNTEKDIYALVIDERKKTMENYDLDYDIDLYFNSIVKKPFQEMIKDGKVSPPGRQEINGHKALTADITGSIEGRQVYYRLAVIETPYAFYQILVWTRADNKDKYFNDMVRMIESFKELPQPDSELPEKKLSDSVKITTPY